MIYIRFKSDECYIIDKQLHILLKQIIQHEK
jgi:hypothetical protein